MPQLASRPDTEPSSCFSFVWNLSHENTFRFFCAAAASISSTALPQTA